LHLFGLAAPVWEGRTQAWSSRGGFGGYLMPYAAQFQC